MGFNPIYQNLFVIQSYTAIIKRKPIFITNLSCRLPIIIQCYDVVALSKSVSMGTQSPYFGIPVSDQVLPRNINIRANPFQSLIRVTCSVIRFDIDRLSNKNSTPNSHVTPPYRSVTFANPIQTRFPFSAWKVDSNHIPDSIIGSVLNSPTHRHVPVVSNSVVTNSTPGTLYSGIILEPCVQSTSYSDGAPSPKYQIRSSSADG